MRKQSNLKNPFGSKFLIFSVKKNKMLINVVVNRLSLYRSFIFSSYNLLTVVVSCCGVVVPSPSVVGSVGGACVDVVLCLPHGYSTVG